jgi:iron complex outermembrane recepter protein
MSLRGGLLCGAAICLSAAFSTGTNAQTTPSSSPAASPEMIETVVVTARRRAESAQEVPVAVTALGPDALAKLFVQDLSDISGEAPNFTIQGVGAIHRNAAVIYSRGIGYNGVDMGQDPAVGVSVNGVFMARNIGMLSTTQDVDHLEILRGPQGTLFGKNTAGGVVQITTVKPGDTFDVEGSVRVGNLGRTDFFLATNIPIDDTLALRVSFLRQDSTGAFKNLYTGPVEQLVPPMPQDLPLPKHLGGQNIDTARATLVWKPFADFEADLVASYMKDRSPSVGGQNGSTPTDALTFFGYPGYDFRTPGQPYPVGPNKPYDVHRNFPSGDFQDSTSVSLNMRYHTDWFDAVSITGYEHDSNLSLSDYDDTELNFFQSTFGLHNDQFSQEVRLESNDSASALKWVVGGLFMGRSWDGTQRFYSLFPTLNNFIDYAQQTDDSLAAFAQGDYTILPGLEATAGIRYTSEAKDIFRIPSHFAPNGSPGTFFFNKSWANISYKLGLDYHIDEDKMV